jgi:hypothetical protein
MFLHNGFLHSFLCGCVINGSPEVFVLRFVSIFIELCLPLPYTLPVHFGFGRKNFARPQSTVRSTFFAAAFSDQ